MSARLRIALLAGVLVCLLLIVAPALAQGDSGLITTTDPQDLDDVAVRLMPLLVGAAIIERTLEILFTWVERALLDASHSLHNLVAFITGFVVVDFRQAWENLNRLTNAMMQRSDDKVAPYEGNPDSNDPRDWPLAMLETRLQQAKERLASAEDVVEKAIRSPEYTTRKKIAAAWMSSGLGVLLAFVAGLRVFDPLGVNVADWFNGPFDVLDLILAGLLMGLGTEYVHQALGILIKSKGALARVGSAAEAAKTMDPERVLMLAEQAVARELDAQTRTLRQQFNLPSFDPNAPSLDTTPGDAPDSGAPDTGPPGGPVVASGPGSSPGGADRTTNVTGTPARPAPQDSGPNADTVFDEPPVETFDSIVADVPNSDAAAPPVALPGSEGRASRYDEQYDDEDPNVSAPALTAPRTPERGPVGAGADTSHTLSAAAFGVMPGVDGLETIPDVTAAVPESAIPLRETTVTVRPGGAVVRAEPARQGAELATFPPDTTIEVRSLVFGDEATWLQIDWDDNGYGPRPAWIPADQTDFARSSDYNQVAPLWQETEPVLAFRRDLVRELLAARGMEPEKVRRVDQMYPEALTRFEDMLMRQTVVPEYTRFWRLQERLQLPDPFDVLPVQPLPPATLHRTEFQGFGPTQYAFDYASIYYHQTRGMNPGLDYLVPEGTPLLAVADGVIVDFPFLATPADRGLALRPFLPEKYRRPDGARVLSNVIVGYGHLMGNPSSDLVAVGDTVAAGEIIGTSGWPVYVRDDGSAGIQHNNAHLHLQVHLITDGRAEFGRAQPFNPLLFFTPRLVALQARLAQHSPHPPYPRGGQPYGRLGFLTVGMFRTDQPGSVWDHEPSAEQIWPSGVYDLDAMLDELQHYTPFRREGGND